MDVPHPNNPPNAYPTDGVPRPEYVKDPPPAPPRPSYIPDGLPFDTICKYAGTFSTVGTPPSAVQKAISIARNKELLYLQRLPDGQGNRPVVPQGKAKSTARVSAKGKVVKTAALGRAAKSVAEEKKEREKKMSEVEEITATTCTLAADMAVKVTASIPVIAKAVSPAFDLAPAINTKAVGLGSDIVARAPATALNRAAPCVLHLAVNGVPRVRISGATSAETEKNSELQAVGLLSGCNKLVLFDVKDGEIRGVRLDGEMYARVTEVGYD